MSKKKVKGAKSAQKQGTNKARKKHRTPPEGIEARKTANGGVIWVAKKGYTANPNGRPRKFISTLAKTQGYSQTEVKDCMEAILGMSEAELKSVVANKDGTVLERTIAKALLNGVNKGNLGNMESIITRSFGYPTKEVAVRTTGDKPLATLNVTVIKSDTPPLSASEKEVDTNKKK